MKMLRRLYYRLVGRPLTELSPWQRVLYLSVRRA